MGTTKWHKNKFAGHRGLRRFCQPHEGTTGVLDVPRNWKLGRNLESGPTVHYPRNCVLLSRLWASGHDKEAFRLFLVGRSLKVFVTGRILCNHYFDSMVGWSLYKEYVFAVLNIRDRVVYADLPALSIAVYTTH
jgi:hypothetical protein